jgi:hypothetical protein
LFCARPESWVTRFLAAVCSATRSRLAPQLVMELALKPSLGRPSTFMKSVDNDPGPLTAIVGPLPPPPAV